MALYEIFFKLKFSKFNQNIRTLDVFGKFLLIVYFNIFLVGKQKKTKCSNEGFSRMPRLKGGRLVKEANFEAEKKMK